MPHAYHARSSPHRTSRATTMGAVCLTAVLLLLAGVPAAAADDSGSGSYQARKSPPTCPEEVDINGGTGSSGLSATTSEASTTSFEGAYDTPHEGLEVTVADDLVRDATVTLCLYDEDGSNTLRLQGVNHIGVDGAVHSSFLAWVEPIEIEQNELTITYGTTGTYAWSAW